jgi:hypothetical protein
MSVRPAADALLRQMADGAAPSFEQASQIKAQKVRVRGGRPARAGGMAGRASRRLSSQGAVEDELRAWLGSHPELQRLSTDLVAAILRDKPDDPVEYASKWVSALATEESKPRD